MNLIIGENTYQIKSSRRVIQVSNSGVVKMVEISFNVFPFSIVELGNLIEANENRFSIQEDSNISTYELAENRSFTFDGDRRILNVRIKNLV